MSCSRPPAPVANQPSLDEGYWEKVWVDPQIVRAETDYTLMRSDRIDSLYHEPDGQLQTSFSSLEFVITEDSCQVSISLEGGFDRSQVVPMMVRTLPSGFYKFTPTSGISLGPIGASDPYLIRAYICGRERFVPVIR
ncbi:MAG: hypothetical protein KOO62_08600 [candidate division Zixibacteria bacterium]|nr:hypothetical protein [candidate division Zixibacteria bacterium]